MRFFLGIVFGFFLLSDLHGRGGFHVHRSYDLDNNGLKEVLVLNARNISAMWIETSLSGDNDTLWSYSLRNNGTFADGEVLDINNDDYLDLIHDDNPYKLEAKQGNLIPVMVQAIKELSAKVKELESKLN